MDGLIFLRSLHNMSHGKWFWKCRAHFPKSAEFSVVINLFTPYNWWLTTDLSCNLNRSSVGYVNWSRGEPNNGGNGNQPEECAMNSATSGHWNDYPCDTKFTYLCKMKGGWLKQIIPDLVYEPFCLTMAIGEGQGGGEGGRVLISLHVPPK